MPTHYIGPALSSCNHKASVCAGSNSKVSHARIQRDGEGKKS
jgi:hypothetical protein